MSKLPIVCIPSNYIREPAGAPIHAVRNQYIRALVEVVQCIPLIIPAIGDKFDLRQIADKIDGILLTGAPSHVNPATYGAERDFEPECLDIERDETSLPIIRNAIDLDIPTFAICRGFQELNVTCGGTLHQFVHKLPGHLDHRAQRDLPHEQRYELLRHKVRAQTGGLFEKIGLPQKFDTNSLHQQGIDKLGSGLFVEGIAEDGLIEAVSMPGKRFILGTQWHPEGDFWKNPVDLALLQAFGNVLHGKKN